MEATDLSPVQNEIAKALEDLSGKATLTEFIVAKKIRENTGINSSKKSGIALADLEKAILFIEEKNIACFSIHVNQANDIVLKKEAEAKEMDPDARKRRLQSEKSMSIFSGGDLKDAKSGKNGGKNSKSGKNFKKRTERRQLNAKEMNVSDFQIE